MTHSALVRFQRVWKFWNSDRCTASPSKRPSLRPNEKGAEKSNSFQRHFETEMAAAAAVALKEGHFLLIAAADILFSRSFFDPFRLSESA